MNTANSLYTYIKKNILTPLEHVTDRINIVHVLLLSLLLAGCSITYQKGGILHPENVRYLPDYLSEKPLLNKLYDNKIREPGLSRTRELSYFFDFIDGKFIALSVSLGCPHFFSLTHYLFSILIGLIIWQFSVRELNLKPLIGVGIVVLFWTSPNVFLCLYIRTAKIGAALAFMVLFFLTYRILRKDWQNNEYRLPPAALLLFFGVAWCAALFDEQGFFLVGIISLFLFLWFIVFPSRNILKLLLTFGAGIIVISLYKYKISSILTFHLNHYWRDLSDQKIPFKQFIIHPFYYIYSSASVFIDTLRFLIGNISCTVTVLLIVILFPMLFISRARIGRKDSKLLLVVAAGFVMSYVLICLMIAIMVSKHPLVLLPDIRREYYWLPITSLLCITIALIVYQLNKIRFISQWLLFVFMVIAIAGNIYAVPQHRAILLQGHLKSDYEFTPRLLAALRNIKDKHYQPSPDVKQNPVYQYFRKSYDEKNAANITRELQQ